jgi:AraC-like DNA-binding protein
MPSTLSIRSYSKQRRGHQHNFHQLVLPLAGAIQIEMKAFTGKVIPSECVVIQAQQTHFFTANKDAKFVVADLDQLPVHFYDSGTTVFSLSCPMSAFLNFIEEQLKHQINPSIEQHMFKTFYALLNEQIIATLVDPRIKSTIDFISRKPTHQHSISELSNIACLGPTQFKKLFKTQTGMTVMQYITDMRMKKAKALLQHTDLPVSLVAHQIGFNNCTAFSRAFSRYFGFSPSKVMD